MTDLDRLTAINETLTATLCRAVNTLCDVLESMVADEDDGIGAPEGEA